jgi:hypothetical protein
MNSSAVVPRATQIFSAGTFAGDPIVSALAGWIMIPDRSTKYGPAKSIISRRCSLCGWS